MKRMRFALSCLVGVSLSTIQSSTFAACPITFPEGGAPAAVAITAPWSSEPLDGTETAPAYFTEQVTTGNAEVPAGSYLGWCVDVAGNINGTTTSYSTLMFSSCDPTLNAQLEALGYSYPGTVYVTPEIWSEINYILNNTQGASFYTIQVAIWNLIGGPLDPTELQSPPYPAWSQTQVTALLAAASTQTSYVPTCGVIAVVVAEISSDPTNPIQLTILQVPILPTGGSLPCFKSVAAAESAALASITSQLGGTAPTSVSYSVSTSDCPATITVTGDACGGPFSVAYTATILTAPPQFTPSTLPPKTATYTSYSQVPSAPTVTATDTCGDTVPVNYSSSESNPNSSCDDVITRTWCATDCAGQTATYTETITVNNTATQTVCGSCGFQGCKSGYVWCNAHLTCNPGKACTVYCQNASVTLTCKNGKTYTYPVPDCQVNFSQNCNNGNTAYQGNCWQTSVPCRGDSQIFLSGCGIPWQSDFANCTSVTWKGDFCCSTPGINCSWQCGASCYNCNLGNCNQIQVKPCYQNSCGWNNSDCAGTPENCKSYCQGGQSSQGGWGSWGGNSFCGNWSNNGSFSCR